MQLIERLPYALCRFHTCLFILHSDVRFMIWIDGLHFFPSLLFSGSFVQCSQLFLQFLTFPIPGRSIIIALSGDVQPRIKAPFPFQNFLSRPWHVKISLTDGPSDSSLVQVNKYIDWQPTYAANRTPSIWIMSLPRTFIYSAFPRTFNANWMRIQHG
jgi:hypothetical protein